jgi:hypothetical protein
MPTLAPASVSGGINRAIAGIPAMARHTPATPPSSATRKISAVNPWSQWDALAPRPPHHIHDRFDETHRPAHGSTLPQKKNHGHQNDRHPQRATHGSNRNVQHGETENPTKEMDEGVGHSTDVHVIQSDGRHWSVHGPQVGEIEVAFAAFFNIMRHVIELADSRFTSEESIPIMLGFLGDRIRELRAGQDKRMALRARLLAEPPAGLPSHPPTTADP